MRQSVPVVPPKLIENRHLSLPDIPTVDVRSLREGGWDGGEGEAAKDWANVWTFALTFDGYRYFGGDTEVTARVGDFSESVRKSYFEHEQLPALDLALLRTCLFYEQRRWCKSSMTPPQPRDREYLAALLRAIRAQIA
jgi:hypothetical protein